MIEWKLNTLIIINGSIRIVCVRYLFCQVVSMEVYAARQPILNQKLEAEAFELLYRNSNTGLAVSLQDPDGATVDVLVHAMFNIGWERWRTSSRRLPYWTLVTN